MLVTTNHYKDDGDANAVKDPEGLETRWENDDAGRRIRLIENFTEQCPENSRVSEYVWHPSGQLQDSSTPILEIKSRFGPTAQR